MLNFRKVNLLLKSLLRIEMLMAAVLVTTLLIVSPLDAKAQSASNDDLSQAQRLTIEELVRNYILNNPEILVEAMDNLQVRRQAEQMAAVQDALKVEQDKILFSEHQVVLGNPDGDVTLVEFFDYNCGFCRRALGDMERLIAEDDDLRVVLKELPVLGQGSFDAAQIAIAANLQDSSKYIDLHRTMLSSRGQADGQTALRAAELVGYDIASLTTLKDDPRVGQALGEVRTLAENLAIQGTPAYIVGREVFPGAVGYDILKESIRTARAQIKDAQ